MCSSLPNESFYLVMRLLKSLSQFKNLTEWRLFQLTDVLTLHDFKDKEVIIKNGPQNDRLYIIKSGRINTYIKDFNVKTYEKGEAFGDITFPFQSASPIGRKNDLQTVYASSGDTVCYVLEKEIYEEITDINNTLFKYDKPFESRDVTFPLDEVYFIKEIGSGGYGKVSLVHNTNSVYAAKSALIKSKNTKTLRYYVNEKNIMGELHHPLIVKIVNTFKTSFHLFFLLEFIEGMTLNKYIKKRPKFTALRNLAETQFVGACFFSIVNYLQRMRIIHRDIKPSNCILNSQGYIKIIDFGIAKDLTGKDKTKTVIGTTQYLSPEMLQGKGYSFSVDYWAIGVLLFKFYYGSLPFGEGEADVMKIYNEISNKALSLPSDDKSFDFNNLISGLLCKNPNKRITSFRQVKQTAMYQHYDFEELNQLKKKSPFTINVKQTKINFNDTGITLKAYVENEMMSQGDSDYYCSEKSNEYIDDF